ncbi:MAG: hypothetical protein R3304_05275, partial [Longimicrobiales bacterium]|nr:hypothetical protein [Longimicrobiales bacterium]
MSESTHLIGLLLGISSGGSASAAATPAGHQSAHEAMVLEAMDPFVQAISDDDLEAMARLRTAEGMTCQTSPGEAGAVQAVARPNAFGIDPARSTTGDTASG